jgi:hypothetical protein
MYCNITLTFYVYFMLCICIFSSQFLISNIPYKYLQKNNTNFTINEELKLQMPTYERFLWITLFE